ncbi:MAG: class I SAM-dependent methyltransferase [Magnetococcus sp. YQC-9]
MLIFLEYCQKIRAGRLLDIGCGGGRTSFYLLGMASDYLGIDYSPGMIELSRQRFPEHQDRFRVLDARCLDDPQLGLFEFILFSFNGLDSVSLKDRQLVLRAIRSRLQPEGIFVFSSHNLHGPSAVTTAPKVRLSISPRQMYWNWMNWRRRMGNHRRLKPQQQFGDGYAILNDIAHDYSLLECGFELIALYDHRGERFIEPGPFPDSKWLHYVCRAA